MKNVNNLPLFSQSHIIRFSQPIAYSVHWNDDTQSKLCIILVYSTGLGHLVHTAVQTHINMLKSCMLRCFWRTTSWLDGQSPLVDFHAVQFTPMWPFTLCTVQLTMCQRSAVIEQLEQKLCSDNNQTWIFSSNLGLHFQVAFIN